jgi:hypothetical protein
MRPIPGGGFHRVDAKTGRAVEEKGSEGKSGDKSGKKSGDKKEGEVTYEDVLSLWDKIGEDDKKMEERFNILSKYDKRVEAGEDVTKTIKKNQKN